MTRNDDDDHARPGGSRARRVGRTWLLMTLGVAALAVHAALLRRVWSNVAVSSAGALVVLAVVEAKHVGLFRMFRCHGGRRRSRE